MSTGADEGDGVAAPQRTAPSTPLSASPGARPAPDATQWAALAAEQAELHAQMQRFWQSSGARSVDDWDAVALEQLRVLQRQTERFSSLLRGDPIAVARPPPQHASAAAAAAAAAQPALRRLLSGARVPPAFAPPASEVPATRELLCEVHCLVRRAGVRAEMDQVLGDSMRRLSRQYVSLQRNLLVHIVRQVLADGFLHYFIDHPLALAELRPYRLGRVKKSARNSSAKTAPVLEGTALDEALQPLRDGIGAFITECRRAPAVVGELAATAPRTSYDDMAIFILTGLTRGVITGVDLDLLCEILVACYRREVRDLDASAPQSRSFFRTESANGFSCFFVELVGRAFEGKQRCAMASLDLVRSFIEEGRAKIRSFMHRRAAASAGDAPSAAANRSSRRRRSSREVPAVDIPPASPRRRSSSDIGLASSVDVSPATPTPAAQSFTRSPSMGNLVAAAAPSPSAAVSPLSASAAPPQRLAWASINGIEDELDAFLNVGRPMDVPSTPISSRHQLDDSFDALIDEHLDVFAARFCQSIRATKFAFGRELVALAQQLRRAHMEKFPAAPSNLLMLDILLGRFLLSAVRRPLLYSILTRLSPAFESHLLKLLAHRIYRLASTSPDANVNLVSFFNSLAEQNVTDLRAPEGIRHVTFVSGSLMEPVLRLFAGSQNACMSSADKVLKAHATLLPSLSFGPVRLPVEHTASRPQSRLLMMPKLQLESPALTHKLWDVLANCLLPISLPADTLRDYLSSQLETCKALCWTELEIQVSDCMAACCRAAPDGEAFSAGILQQVKQRALHGDSRRDVILKRCEQLSLTFDWLISRCAAIATCASDTCQMAVRLRAGVLHSKERDEIQAATRELLLASASQAVDAAAAAAAAASQTPPPQLQPNRMPEGGDLVPAVAPGCTGEFSDEHLVCESCFGAMGRQMAALRESLDQVSVRLRRAEIVDQWEGFSGLDLQLDDLDSFHMPQLHVSHGYLSGNGFDMLVEGMQAFVENDAAAALYRECLCDSVFMEHLARSMSTASAAAKQTAAADDTLRRVQAELQRIAIARTPSGKTRHIVLAFDALRASFSEEVSPDDFVPAMADVIRRCFPPCLLSAAALTTQHVADPTQEYWVTQLGVVLTWMLRELRLVSTPAGVSTTPGQLRRRQSDGELEELLENW